MALLSTKIVKVANEIVVKHVMLVSIVDGKFCNAATENRSTMLRCYNF